MEILKLLIQIFATAMGAFLALLFNRHLDNRKADREYATGLSETVREHVLEAMDVASEYWSGITDSSKKIILEGKIRALHSEIKNGSRLLDDHSTNEESSKLDIAVKEFLKHLTGSTFEQKIVPEDKHHVIILISKGSKLRSELAHTRRLQIKK